jgi:hypothetical protein
VSRRIRALARGLGLPDPFDIGELCRTVGTDRGRPIVLAALPMAAAGPCGLWLATATVDMICYERATSALHQQHIVLHELGHILGDHGDPDHVPDLFGGLVPEQGLDALKIMLARQRATHSGDDEQEAELFAFTVLDRVGRRPGRPRDPAGASYADRLGRALED